MRQSPVLSFEEIVSVGSINALNGLYSQKGYRFPTQKDFLAAVKSDWVLEQARIGREAVSKGYPLNLPSLEVLVDGAVCKVYGVTHGSDSQKYVALVTRTVNESGNWLFEQNISQEFPHAKGAIEIPDHSLISFWANLKQSLKDSFKFPAMLIIYLLPASLKASTDPFGILPAPDSALEYTNVPLRAHAEGVPAYVGIGLREAEGRPNYTLNQKRSAYQAEFMRAWKKGEDKRILVGAAHAPEVEYFLTNGVKDSAVVGLANQHVELLKHYPGQFMQIGEGINRKERLADNIGSVAGVYSGILPFMIPLVLSFDMRTRKFPNIRMSLK